MPFGKLGKLFDKGKDRPPSPPKGAVGYLLLSNMTRLPLYDGVNCIGATIAPPKHGDVTVAWTPQVASRTPLATIEKWQAERLKEWQKELQTVAVAHGVFMQGDYIASEHVRIWCGAGHTPKIQAMHGSETLWQTLILPPGADSQPRVLRAFDRVPVRRGMWVQLGHVVVRVVIPWVEPYELEDDEHAVPVSLTPAPPVGDEGAQALLPTDMHVGVTASPARSQRASLEAQQPPVHKDSGHLQPSPQRSARNSSDLSSGRVIMRATDVSGSEWIRNKATRSLEIQRQRASLDEQIQRSGGAMCPPRASLDIQGTPAQVPRNRASLDTQQPGARQQRTSTDLAAGNHGQPAANPLLARIVSGELAPGRSPARAAVSSHDGSTGLGQSGNGATWVATQARRTDAGGDALAAKAAKLALAQQTFNQGRAGIRGAP